MSHPEWNGLPTLVCLIKIIIVVQSTKIETAYQACSLPCLSVPLGGHLLSVPVFAYWEAVSLFTLGLCGWGDARLSSLFVGVSATDTGCPCLLTGVFSSYKIIPCFLNMFCILVYPLLIRVSSVQRGILCILCYLVHTVVSPVY